MLCSYPGDGGSLEGGKTCKPAGVSASCVPGCWKGAPSWCPVAQGKKCAFRPDDLASMLEQQPGHMYNEVILDAATYLANLPHSLEAVIGNAAVHAAFLAEYHVASEQVPLVSFEAAAGFRWIH